MRYIILPLMTACILLASASSALATDAPSTTGAGPQDGNPGTAKAPITFSLMEPTHATAVGNQDLTVGTKLEFSAHNFKADEVLLLNRCGEACNSSKVIGQWKASDFPAGSHCEVVITEPGTYYIWIQRITPDGETGPVFGTSVKINGATSTINYASGTSVSITAIKP